MLLRFALRPKQIISRFFSKALISSPPVITTGKNIDEILRNIDTTLTPEQRIHVEKLKRKIKGGPNSPRSLYRDIPTPDEIDKYFSESPPKIPENAEALIDYALTFIPPRQGPRRSRRKKRHQLKLDAVKKQNDAKKVQLKQANLRKIVKAKKQKELVKMYKEMGAVVRATKSAARTSQNHIEAKL